MPPVRPADPDLHPRVVDMHRPGHVRPGWCPLHTSDRRNDRPGAREHAQCVFLPFASSRSCPVPVAFRGPSVAPIRERRPATQADPAGPSTPKATNCADRPPPNDASRPPSHSTENTHFPYMAIGVEARDLHFCVWLALPVTLAPSNRSLPRAGAPPKVNPQGSAHGSDGAS